MKRVAGVILFSLLLAVFLVACGSGSSDSSDDGVSGIWREVKYETDSDNDGNIDRVAYITYDSNGNMIKYEDDNDNDGTIDGVEYYTSLSAHFRHGFS